VEMNNKKNFNNIKELVRITMVNTVKIVIYSWRSWMKTISLIKFFF